MTQDEALHKLLLDLFDPAELRRWIEHGQHTKVIAPDLPGDTSDAASLVHVVVRSLKKHGLINSGFFERLRSERPNRAQDVSQIESLWPSTINRNRKMTSFPPKDGASSVKEKTPSADDTPSSTLIATGLSPGTTTNISNIPVDEIDLEEIRSIDLLGSSHQAVLIKTISAVTRITSSKRIITALAAAPQQTVRDVMAAKWPTTEKWLTWTVSQIRDHHLVWTIAKHVGWTPEALLQRLRGEHGNTTLVRIVGDPKLESPAGVSLGRLTLAQVERRKLIEKLTNFLEKKGILQQRGVTRRFNNNQRNALVRNVFREVPDDEWPMV